MVQLQRPAIGLERNSGVRVRLYLMKPHVQEPVKDWSGMVFGD